MGVAKSGRFEEQLAQLGAGLERLDEAISFAEEQLTNHPASGIPTAVPGIYSFPTRLPTGNGLAHVSIFYLYDGKDVRFIDLKRSP